MSTRHCADLRTKHNARLIRFLSGNQNRSKRYTFYASVKEKAGLRLGMNVCTRALKQSNLLVILFISFMYAFLPKRLLCFI